MFYIVEAMPTGRGDDDKEIRVGSGGGDAGHEGTEQDYAANAGNLASGAAGARAQLLDPPLPVKVDSAGRTRGSSEHPRLPPLCLATRVEFPRVARREPVRISRRDGVLVQPVCGLDQVRRAFEVGRQSLDEAADRVAPRLTAPCHDDRRQRLLSRLLCGECRPLVVGVLERVPRVADIALSLIPPVFPAVHRVLGGIVSRELARAAHVAPGLMTRSDLHYGRAEAKWRQGAEALRVAYQAHSERFPRGVRVPPSSPTAAWIAPPERATHERSSQNSDVDWLIPLDSFRPERPGRRYSLIAAARRALVGVKAMVAPVFQLPRVIAADPPVAAFRPAARTISAGLRADPAY
jgi:hypothetical protein